jgi:hypothetical protein
VTRRQAECSRVIVGGLPVGDRAIRWYQGWQNPNNPGMRFGLFKKPKIKPIKPLFFIYETDGFFNSKICDKS